MSAPVIDLFVEADVATHDASGSPESSIGARLVLAPIPAHQPPLEDRRGTLRLARMGGQQLALPLRIPPTAPDGDPVFGPQITGREELPDPEPWARRLLQATLESIAGQRSPAQLQYWTSWGVYRDVVRVAQRSGPRRGRTIRGPQVYLASIRVCEPADGVAEVCAVARRDGRWHAVAARLEGIDGRWRCVSLTVG